MATLMNVNNQAMPMGDNTGASGDGQTGPKRHFKHIGELVDGGAKVVIMYRTVPGEPNNCLVVGTKFLPDMYHNALMKAVEGDAGQAPRGPRAARARERGRDICLLALGRFEPEDKHVLGEPTIIASHS